MKYSVGDIVQWTDSILIHRNIRGMKAKILKVYNDIDPYEVEVLEGKAKGKAIKVSGGFFTKIPQMNRNGANN